MVVLLVASVPSFVILPVAFISPTMSSVKSGSGFSIPMLPLALILIGVIVVPSLFVLMSKKPVLCC